MMHVPPCDSIDTHIEASVKDTAGAPIPLDTFVDETRRDWDQERVYADAEDEAVVAYWQQVQSLFQADPA